jgi:heme/copper-type cytochrome/quinol oxidase subunit 3
MVKEAPTGVPEVVAAAPPDNATLALWVWLSAEAVFFASLIGTYLLLHTQTNHGITPQQAFDLPLTFVGTIILLSSSMTMALGYAQIQRGNVPALRRWLVVTSWGWASSGSRRWSSRTSTPSG